MTENNFNFEIYNEHADNTQLLICQSKISAKQFHKMVQEFIDSHDDVGVIGTGKRRRP